ncbi:homeobox protein 2-like [Aricia agestis]|uniref:homeobox protein 2-like n=1 Tax=Aricia agestis TaxID=91739 RepID=UPI001C2015F4|nr:homeobox protein 2-like [Aricia agestis]
MTLMKFTLLVLNIGFVLSHDIFFDGMEDDEDFYVEFTNSDEKPVKNVIPDKQKGVVKIPVIENGVINSLSIDKVNVPGKVKLQDMKNIPPKNPVVTLPPKDRMTKVPSQKNKRVINKSENDGVIYLPVHNVNIPSKKVYPVNIPSKNEQNSNAPSLNDKLAEGINNLVGNPKDVNDLKFKLDKNMKEESDKVVPEAAKLPGYNQVHHFILYLNKPDNAAAVRGEDDDVVVGKVKLNNGDEGYLIFDSVIGPSETGEHTFIGNFAGYELRPQDVSPIKSYINDYYDKLNKHQNSEKSDKDNNQSNINNNGNNNRDVVQKYHPKYPINDKNDKRNSNNQIDQEYIIKLLNNYLQSEDVGDSHDDDLMHKNQLNHDRDDKNRGNKNHINNKYRHINNNDRHINNKEVVVAVNCQDIPNTLKTLFGC